MKFLFQGAESTISVDGDVIVKERLRKPYRIEELDIRIMKTRTRKEARFLKKLETLGIPAPRLIRTEGNVIVMQRIHGVTLKEKIESSSDASSLFYSLGVLVSRLHAAHIIHGDLTTSNFMFSDAIYAIDFGLSYVSAKEEDKAVDLYVFERAVNCAHDCRYLADFHRGYRAEGSEEVEKKLEVVRLRGRKREETMFG